jgi:hypothetical protein
MHTIQLTRRRRSGQRRSRRNAEPLHLLKFDLVPFQTSDCTIQLFDLFKRRFRALQEAIVIV